MAAATSVHAVAIIEPIIQHADWFFPEGDASVMFKKKKKVSNPNWLKSRKEKLQTKMQVRAKKLSCYIRFLHTK